MAHFRYIVLSKEEGKHEYRIEADSQREAEQKLRSLKLIPVKFLGEAEQTKQGMFHRSKVDVLDFTDQLAPLLNSSIPLERSMGIIAEGATTPDQKKFVLSLRQGLHEGKKFSELVRSCGDWFPGYYANLIETGEETGRMPEVVTELHSFMSESKELKNFIVTSSIYPVVVLSITIIVTLLMFTVFVPHFAEMFTNMGRELPGSMLFLMSLSKVLLWGVIALPFLWALWHYGVRSWLGVEKFREMKARIFLKIPLLGGLATELEMGKFIRTLAILVSNHVDIIKTVRIAVNVIQNPVIRNSFSELEGRLKSGKKLSAALADNPYVPGGLSARLRVGEESGTSGNMLLKSAANVEARSRQKIKRLLSMFEPLVIVFLALVVMTVVLAVFMSIMDLNSVDTE